MQISAELEPQHVAALSWFAKNTAEEMAWPEPLDGLFLVNKAKGIHKPAGFRYALSIRQSLAGPYADSLDDMGPDGWELRYAHEGENPEYFTNKALRHCMTDGVPVGVILQVKPKPDPRYKVLGLGRIVEELAGAFVVRPFDESDASGPSKDSQSKPKDYSGAPSELPFAIAGTAFDPSGVADERERQERSIAVRRGQPAFRAALLDAYSGSCAVTGCNASAVLEAAHIFPYQGDATNHPANGLLLRADVHTLFDLGLLTVEPETFEVRVATDLVDSEYAVLDGSKIRLPENQATWPSREALRLRWKQFQG